MTDELVFETPPENNKGSWSRRIRMMAMHPGEWVNATESFGLSRKSGGSVSMAAKRAAEKIGITLEVQVVGQSTDHCAVYMRVVKEEA